MAQEKIQEKKIPEKKFRAGAITAAVWNNVVQTKEGSERSFKTISFERNYKDGEGTWKTTHSLRASDLPRAVLVLNKAFEYVSLSGYDNDIAVEEM